MTDPVTPANTSCSPEDEPGPWQMEHAIPAEHFLYMRVLKDDVDEEGIPKPKVFKNRVDDDGVWAMSTDWSKYCAPQATQARAVRRPASDYGVVALNVGAVTRIPAQSVVHAPIHHAKPKPEDPNNRGHVNVLGPKSPKDDGGSVEIRARYIAILREDEVSKGWVIPPTLPDAPR